MKKLFCLTMAVIFVLLVSGTVFAFACEDKSCPSLNNQGDLYWVYGVI